METCSDIQFINIIAHIIIPKAIEIFVLHPDFLDFLYTKSQNPCLVKLSGFEAKNQQKSLWREWIIGY